MAKKKPDAANNNLSDGEVRKLENIRENYPQYRAALQKLIARLSGDMGVTSDAIGSEKKERDVGDTVDEVVVREGEELSLSLGAKTSTRLKQAKEGLIRIQDDTFGACKKCLKPISLARLNAIPESPHCVKCSDEK